MITNAATVTMKRKLAFILTLCLVAAGWLSAPSLAAAADRWFTPHRGLYRMSLASAESSSGIIGASGEMYFEWVDACDGWNVNQHTNLILATSQDTNNQIGLTFSGWEAKDGMKLRFQSSHFANGGVIDNIEGEASLSASGGAGTVVYSKPDAVSADLPEGTLFPSEYSRRMMASMRAGERRYSALMFDGSTIEGTYEVSTVFAAPRMHALPGASDGDASAGEEVWPVRMAYFPIQGGDVEPDFEVGALINAFGVAHHYDIDYGNFAVRAVLELYEEIAAPDC
ncbi:MAG TPA: DUF1849 family protein [Alphaproteobacteria bacterium]|nr:DUF1849 family protein [Alphaproteobacteria bacterium]